MKDNITPEYIPYGEEWVKEMKRLPKEFLIGMIKDLNLARKEMEKLPPLREVVSAEDAETFLNKQGYTEKVKYPDGKEIEPTFQRITVIRLLNEYLSQSLPPATAQEHDREYLEHFIEWRERFFKYSRVLYEYESIKHGTRYTKTGLEKTYEKAMLQPPFKH